MGPWERTGVDGAGVPLALARDAERSRHGPVGGCESPKRPCSRAGVRAIGELHTWGTNTGAGNIVEHWRPWATRATLGWYKPDLFMGNHDFKAGYDDVKTTSGRGWIERVGTPTKGDYLLRFNAGAPLQLVVYNAPNFPKTTVHSTGAYVADQWGSAASFR